ncbi:MAG: DUF934 domain-containing protein [Gammaproteobacteria bacterium]|nr:DUF934 domain-containing protein [Gammaproteobacteria bacterium]
MPRLVKNGTLSDDAWTFYETPPAAVPDGESIVPFDYWRTHGSEAPWGVWVEGDFEVETLGPAVGDVPLIAVRFAVFSDGRGLSLGSMLRTRYGFTGELRAVGDILPDIASYLARSGFDAIEFKDAASAAVGIEMISTMSDAYQASVVQPQPPFRRVSMG